DLGKNPRNRWIGAGFAEPARAAKLTEQGIQIPCSVSLQGNAGAGGLKHGKLGMLSRIWNSAGPTLLDGKWTIGRLASESLFLLITVHTEVTRSIRNRCFHEQNGVTLVALLGLEAAALELVVACQERVPAFRCPPFGSRLPEVSDDVRFLRLTKM